MASILSALLFVTHAVSRASGDFEMDVKVDDWCELKCGSEPHTVCSTQCQMGSLCHNYAFYPLTDKERQFIIDMHNHCRNLVASGKDPYGFGPATNIMVMNYEKLHEVTTYCWARQCSFKHDTCRNIPKHPWVGQNLALYQSTGQLDASELQHINFSIVRWYNELRDVTKSLVQSFYVTKDDDTGHATQLLWHSTVDIGCSRVHYTEAHDGHIWSTMYFVCNYGPGGNVLQQPVYELGSAASNCPAGTKPNAEYPALCGELIRLSEERIPFTFTGAGGVVHLIDKFALVLVLCKIFLMI